MHSNLFYNTINALSCCEFILDEQGNPYNLRFLDVNPAQEKLLGIPKDEIIGRTCLDLNLFTGPQGMEVIKEAEKAVRSGDHYETEYFWYPLNKWLEVQIFKLNENNFGLILRDITERKKADEALEQANEALQENVEKYRTIFNSLDQAFCIVEMIYDSEGKPVDWRYLESNPTHEMYTRIKNVEGKLISQLAPKTEPYWFEIYGKVVATGEPVRIVEAAIGKRSYDLYAFKIGGQDCNKVAVFCYDITERKKYEEQLKEQAKAIDELSTPVIQLWDGILALPLIGTIDSARAKQIMENLLSEIVKSKSSQVVIDITGVPIVDTGVASRLMRTVEAARLLGAECILTGISPVIAQTLVTVGVNLGSIKTQGTLKNGLESALKNLNMQVNKNGNGNIN